MSSRLLLGSVGPALALALAFGTAEAQTSSISNGLVRLDFHVDPVYGLVFDSLQDLANSGNTVQFRPLDLWTVELNTPVPGTPVLVAPSTSTSAFSIPPAYQTPSSFLAIWSAISSPAFSGNLQDVFVLVTAPANDPVIKLEIGVLAIHAPGRSLYGVRFPRIEVLERGTPNSQRLAHPNIGGTLIHDPLHNPALVPPSSSPRVNGVYTHPGMLSMQWFSYYDGSGKNLFFGTRDLTGHDKDFWITATDSTVDGLRIDVRQTPADNLNAQIYAPPYPFVMRPMLGDWYDAARFYRSWATQQPITAAGPMRSSSTFSAAVRNADLFGVVGPAQCSTPPCILSNNSAKGRPDPSTFQYWPRDITDMATLLGTSNIVSAVYGWDFNSQDHSWGDWLPVPTPFATAAAQAQSLGHVFGPYFENVVYSDRAPEFGTWQILDAAFVNEDGSPLASSVETCDKLGTCSGPFVPVTATDYGLCLANKYTEQYSLSYAGYLNSIGAGGIYLDVLSHARAAPCYSNDHWHPPGGTSEYTAGMRTLVQGIKAAGAPGSYVHSESPQEMFLGLIDLTFENSTPPTLVTGGSTVLRSVAPLYDAVYHDYQRCMTIGSALHFPSFWGLSNAAVMQGFRRDYAGRIFLGLAPYAGSQLEAISLPQALAMPQNAPFAAFFGMAQQFASILKRPETRDLVVLGERRRDPVTDSHTANVAGALFGREAYDAEEPYVYAVAFSRPDLNAAGVLLMNWTEAGDPGLTAPGNQTIQYKVDPAQHGLQLNVPYRMWESTATGAVQLGVVTFTGLQTFTAAVNARSARFFYFAP